MADWGFSSVIGRVSWDVGGGLGFEGGNEVKERKFGRCVGQE